MQVPRNFTITFILQYSCFRISCSKAEKSLFQITIDFKSNEQFSIRAYEITYLTYVCPLLILTSAVLRFLRKNIITCFIEAITSYLQSNLRNKNIFDIFITVLYCGWFFSRLFPNPLNYSICLERAEICSMKTEAHRKCWYAMKRDNLQKFNN